MENLAYVCTTTHAVERMEQRGINVRELFIIGDRNRRYIDMSRFQNAGSKDGAIKWEEKGKSNPLTVVLRKGNGKRFQLITTYFKY